MGWNPQTLSDLADTLSKAGQKLGPGLRIIDVGSQDIWMGSAAELETLRKLVKVAGGNPNAFPSELMFPARVFFEACGVDYWCTDIDERPKTMWLDLNLGKIPKGFAGTFDVVCNVGTTEHVANPVTALFVIHQLAKPQGILFHDVPMSGFGNHAFLNYTPKFWHAVIWMNRYTVLHSRTRRCDEDLVDPANFRPDHLNYFEGIEATKQTSFLVQLAFKKMESHVFRPPLDMWPGMTRSQFRRCAEGAMACYPATGVVTKEDVAKSIEELTNSVGGLVD